MKVCTLVPLPRDIYVFLVYDIHTVVVVPHCLDHLHHQLQELDLDQLHHHQIQHLYPDQHLQMDQMDCLHQLEAVHPALGDIKLLLNMMSLKISSMSRMSSTTFCFTTLKKFTQSSGLDIAKILGIQGRGYKADADMKEIVVTASADIFWSSG